MNEESRYATLRDYLALLRRQRWVVLAVTVAIAGAVLALSSNQEKTYESEASASFDDLTQELSILGANAPVTENSLQRASKKAEEVTRLATARKVQRRLETDVTPNSLQNAVSTRVGVQTSFVEVTAQWSDPQFAADIANAFAQVAIDEENRAQRALIDDVIKDLEAQAGGDLSLRDIATDPDRVIATQALVRIRPLQDSVETATMARRAEVPTDPVSPKVLRNTLIAAVVGLALGLLVAFVRDSLDRKIRSSKDAHDEFGFPVIGRVGLSALGSAGLLSNGRRVVTQMDLEAFRILRTNIAILDREKPPRSVLVSSGLPQEGKSTVAAALAAASAAAGQRTLLVEADLRRPVLAERTGLQKGPGLADYLAGTASPREILQVVPIRPGGAAGAGNGANGQVQPDRAGDEGAPSPQAERALVVITAGSPPAEPAELLASDRCRDFLGKVAKVYDLVVLDTSPMLSTADPLELIPHVDGVLICVRIASSTHDEARAVASAVELLPERPTGLVVTAVGPGEGGYGYYGYYG